jgi:inorganic pyrophosphatase
LPRGGLISVKLIGVLKLLDGGEQDDKLIAVTSGTSFFRVEDMAHLNRDFPGVSSILETWFTHYKGDGEMQSLGFSDAQAAEKLLSAAIEQYRRSQ